MRTETTDPITGHDVRDLPHAPFVIDGDLTIYFESGQSKAEFLDIEVEHPGNDF